MEEGPPSGVGLTFLGSESGGDTSSALGAGPPLLEDSSTGQEVKWPSAQGGEREGVREKRAGSPCSPPPSGANLLCPSGSPTGRSKDGTSATPVAVHSQQDVCQLSLDPTGHVMVGIHDHGEREVLSNPTCKIQSGCHNDLPCSLRRNVWRQRACRSLPILPTESRQVVFHSVSSLVTNDLFELIVQSQSHHLNDQRADMDADPPVQGDSPEYLELLGPTGDPAGQGTEGADSHHPTGQLPAEREQLTTGPETSAEGEKIPAEGMIPAEGENTPAEGVISAEGKIPAEGKNIPAEMTKIPADGEMFPAEGENIPAEGKNVPAGGEKIPAEGELIPAEGNKIPAEGERIPAEGKKIPAEGERIPAEGEDSPAVDFPAEIERISAGEDSPAEIERIPAEGEGTPAEVAAEKGASPTDGEREIQEEMAAAPAGPSKDPGPGKGLGGRKTPDEELYNTILQHQSARARIEDQRSHPPASSPRDFFDLLERLQEQRMEEQRAPAPPGLGLKGSLSPSRDQRRTSTLGPLLKGLSQRRANSN
ncbi:sodium/potassium/calcium exchanger 1-like isoform X2 [Narcine bancroftii]|uniref:sodium/potassium/calcium exchanger 1-like isoform X2 n=1 Tax=Narcine bancroftii TaxID=1343680 RepID=UPI0038314E3F